MRHLLIIDIETKSGNNVEESLTPFIKTLKVSAKVKGNPLAEARERKENQQEVFEKALLSPVCSQILCIGVNEIEIPQGGERIDILGDVGQKATRKWHFIIHPNEENMLRELHSLIRNNSEYVTFNGRGFDFPFLMFRAAINRVPLALPIYPYNGKDRHFDLMVHLNSVSNLHMLDRSMQYISLKKWIEYFSLPYEKPSIKDGGIDLEQLLIEDQLETIEKYCRDDVDATTDLWEIFKGNFEETPQWKMGQLASKDIY